MKWGQVVICVAIHATLATLSKNRASQLHTDTPFMVTQPVFDAKSGNVYLVFVQQTTTSGTGADATTVSRIHFEHCLDLLEPTRVCLSKLVLIDAWCPLSPSTCARPCSAMDIAGTLINTTRHLSSVQTVHCIPAQPV